MLYRQSMLCIRYWRCLGGGMQGPPAGLIPAQEHHHQHSKAVGQHPTHIGQHQHSFSQHKQQQQQQMDTVGVGEPHGVWRVNSIPPPGSRSAQQQQQPEIQRIATPALGAPNMHANGFAPPQQQQQQRCQRPPAFGPPTSSGIPPAAAGSSDVSDPFAVQANWSFSDGHHQDTAAAASGPPAAAEGGSSVDDALLLAQLRRQLQSEGGPSLEMPLSAAPTLSSTFSM